MNVNREKREIIAEIVPVQEKVARKIEIGIKKMKKILKKMLIIMRR